MRLLELRMRDSVFNLRFDSDLLASRFERSFVDALAVSSAGQACIELEVTGEDFYTALVNGGVVEEGLTEGLLSLRVTRLFGEALRSSITAEECSLHASSVAMGSKAVCFVGKSGAGKSTLSLLMSEYGQYMGDEYAVLNTHEGTIYHEPYPVQVKEGSAALFPGVDFSQYLALDNEGAFFSHLVPVADMSGEVVPFRSSVPVGAIVFPFFDGGFGETVLRKLSLPALPGHLLSSATGRKAPAVLVRDFIRFISSRNVPVYTVEYSDGFDAAMCLAKELANR